MSTPFTKMCFIDAFAGFCVDVAESNKGMKNSSREVNYRAFSLHRADAHRELFPFLPCAIEQ